MSARFTLTAAPGGALTTSCKTCGDTHTAANKSWLDAWRARHQCPKEDEG